MTYPLLDRAIRFAADAHAGSERDGEWALPYITHPMAVLEAVRYTGGVHDEALLCVAVLHDTIEDTAVTLDELRLVFGDRITRLVHELTRTEPSASETAGLDADQVWSLRSSMLLSDIAVMSKDAMTIKLADRYCNLRDARREKTGRKLERYVRQPGRILELIPSSVNPELWNAVNARLGVAAIA